MVNEKGSFGLEDSLNLWSHIDASEDCQIHFKTHETTATLLLSSYYADIVQINQEVFTVLPPFRPFGLIRLPAQVMKACVVTVQRT